MNIYPTIKWIISLMNIRFFLCFYVLILFIDNLLFSWILLSFCNVLINEEIHLFIDKICITLFILFNISSLLFLIFLFQLNLVYLLFSGWCYQILISYILLYLIVKNIISLLWILSWRLLCFNDNIISILTWHIAPFAVEFIHKSFFVKVWCTTFFHYSTASYCCNLLYIYIFIFQSRWRFL